MQRTPNLNKSRRSADSASASMYLSFDADSTISSAYKTMDNFNDMTAMMFMARENAMAHDDDDDQKDDAKVPSNLAANRNAALGLQTYTGAIRKTTNLTTTTTTTPSLMSSKMKKKAMPPQSVFADYQTLHSSTPTITDEQLLSRNAHCKSLLLAANSSEIDELKGAFVNPTDGINDALSSEFDKENELPDSHSSSANAEPEPVTVIERKTHTLQVPSVLDDDEDLYTDSDEAVIETDSTPRELGGAEAMRSKMQMKGMSKMPLPKRKSMFGMRKSIAEPDMQTNRPSRILPKSRQSMIPQQKPLAAINKNPTMRQSLLPKSARSSNSTTSSYSSEQYMKPMQQRTEKNINLLKQTTNGAVPKRTLNRYSSTASSLSSGSVFNRANMSRKSLLKTTLNSPGTNKLARRSMMTAAASKRRQTINAAAAATKPKNNAANRAAPKKPMVSPRKRFYQTDKIDENIEDDDETAAIVAAQKLLKKLHIEQHECSICGIKFRVKALLEAHKRVHELPKQPKAGILKKLTPETTSMTSVNSKTEYDNPQNQCKYCDKKFAIARALHVHLMEHCSKIPHAERRKLNFTELNHVEKAQLPVFPNTVMPPRLLTRSNSLKNSLKKYELAALVQHLPSTDVMAPKEAVNNFKQRLTLAVDATAPPVGGCMQAPTDQKVPKKTTAHAGVYRTPSKTVPCLTCNMSFPTVLDYTNHCLAKHSQMGNLSSD